MTEYRWATEADYRNIIEEANHAFDGKHWTGDFEKDTDKESYFPKLLPKLYQNIKTAPMHVLALEDGVIVGLVGNFELNMKAADENLFVIGIGTVSTHPDYRRTGNMKKLMAMSIDRAKERKADMMLLGGLRQRYEHWGFECAGLNPQFKVTKTAYRHLCGESADFGYKFKKLEASDNEYIMMERLMRTTALTSTVHEKEQEYNILFSMGNTPYVILKNGEFAGTLMFDPNWKSVCDLRLKEPEETGRVMNDLLKSGLYEGNELNIHHIPLYEKKMLEILSAQAEDMQIVNCGMIKILNYGNTIRAYMKLAAAYKKLVDGEAVLAFENGETLKISVKAGVPSVEKWAGEKPEVLPELTAVNLLFGISGVYSEFSSGLSPEALSWFPLPFFQYMSDEV